MENNNINSTSTVIGWFEKFLEMVKQHSLWDFFKSGLLIFIAGTMMFIISNPEKILDTIREYETERHQELITERLQTNAQVQKICDKLLYSYPNSLRVVLTECHNGNSNSGTGLPFAKISATYESLQEDIFPVSTQYKDVNLSLIPFATYLSDTHYYCGSSISIKSLDKSLAYRFLANKAEYFSAVSIIGPKGTIGFLMISFDSIENIDRDKLKLDMERASIELSVLLSTRKDK